MRDEIILVFSIILAFILTVIFWDKILAFITFIGGIFVFLIVVVFIALILVFLLRFLILPYYLLKKEKEERTKPMTLKNIKKN